MSKPRELSCIHNCQDDAGNTYSVREYVSYIPFSGMTGTQHVKGNRTLEMEDGRPVNWIEEDVFQVADSGLVLTKIAQ